MKTVLIGAFGAALIGVSPVLAQSFPSQFDLQCTGTIKTPTADQPWSERYRLDLGRQVACKGECKNPVFSPAGAITLSVPDASVSRITGRLEGTDKGLPVRADCVPRPFTPIPQQMF